MRLQVDNKSMMVQDVLLVSIVSIFEINYITTIRSQGLIARKIPADYMQYLGHGLTPSCERWNNLFLRLKQGLLLEPETYESYCPEKVGAERKLLFGTKSGRKAVKQKLQSIAERKKSGMTCIDGISRFRQISEYFQRTLTEHELENYFSSSKI